MEWILDEIDPAVKPYSTVVSTPLLSPQLLQLFHSKANTNMNTRGTLWPSVSTVSGWVKAAWMMRPMRVLVNNHHNTTIIPMAVSMMKPRVIGNGLQATTTKESAEAQTLPAEPQTNDRPC